MMVGRFLQLLCSPTTLEVCPSGKVKKENVSDMVVYSGTMMTTLKFGAVGIEGNILFITDY